MMNKMELNRIYGKKYQDGITVSAHVLALYEVYLPTCMMTRHLMLAIYSTGLRLFTFFFLQVASYQDDVDCWLQVCLDNMSGHPLSACKWPSKD